jgi:hypothetical protein
MLGKWTDTCRMPNFGSSGHAATLATQINQLNAMVCHFMTI